jgi:hypothetical protein
MPLIPSESLSFPDDFSRAITRARALNEAKATAALLNARGKRTRGRGVIPPPPPEEPPAVQVPVNLTPSKPVATKIPPMRAPVPEPPRAKSVPAETLPVKETPLPEPVPVSSVVPILPKPLPKVLPPKKNLPAKAALEKAAPIKLRPRALGETPANVAARAQAENQPPVNRPQEKRVPIRITPTFPIAPKRVQPVFDQVEDEPESRPQVRGHRRRKLTRFIFIEGIAVGVLVPTAILALTHYFTDPVMVWIMNGLTITGALVAGIVPILFFAISPTLPRIER